MEWLSAVENDRTIGIGKSPNQIEERGGFMVERHYVFPGVIEMNVQARRRLGVNIYLIDGGSEFALIDVGFLDELPEVLEMIRRMGFSFANCKLILATHADADHAQGLSRAQ